MYRFYAAAMTKFDSWLFSSCSSFCDADQAWGVWKFGTEFSKPGGGLRAVMHEFLIEVS